jgi:hypothetical protein
MTLNKEQKTLLITSLLIISILLYTAFKKTPISIEDTSSATGEDAMYLLNDWKRNFESKDLEGITNLYSSQAILVSTFGGIMKGRNEIKDYFDDLFENDNLKVDFLGNPHIGVISDLTVFTGVYLFSYTKKGELVKVKARYSFLCKLFNGKLFIIKQHSSAFHQK